MLPAADSSPTGLGNDPVWTGTLWQSALTPTAITFDAAYWRDPTTRDPDFEPAGDHPVSSPPDRPGTGPALAIGPVLPSPIPVRNPMFAFWTTESAPSEIVSRGGLLDPLGPPRHPRTARAVVTVCGWGLSRVAGGNCSGGVTSADAGDDRC